MNDGTIDIATKAVAGMVVLPDQTPVRGATVRTRQSKEMAQGKHGGRRVRSTHG